MSQKISYACDKCGKTIGDKPHISIRFHDHSGIAVPPEHPMNMNPNWSIFGKLNGKFLHFCTSQHLKEYFDKLEASVVDKMLTKKK